MVGIDETTELWLQIYMFGQFQPVNQEVSCAMILRLLSILFYTKVGKLLRPKVQSQAEANQCIYQIGGQYNL